MSVLDWHVTVPEPVVHDCNCDYCDEVGRIEEVEPPALVTLIVDGVTYVSDRFLAIRSDLAPIPEDWEHQYPKPVKFAPSRFMAAAVTDERVVDPLLRPSSKRGLDSTDWRLHVTDFTPEPGRGRALAVVTPDGEHIGWAMEKRVAS